jgi:hypothetical protein
MGHYGPSSEPGDTYRVRDRMFQVWTFRTTHTTLVLVSNRNVREGRLTRIEVAFAGVVFMALPPVLRDLHIRRADPDFRSRMTTYFDLDLSDEPDVDMYRISESGDWFVVSGRPFGAEAERSYSDPLVLFEDLAPESPELTRWVLG